MANKNLFASIRGLLLPAATAVNDEAAPAYAFEPRHALAQYAATGCLNRTFYAGDAEQLTAVLALAKELDASFIARTAIYARQRGAMKDMPALLLAVLASKDPQLLKAVFARVADNGRMVRTFVQILRSGVTGRKSLGTVPKRLVQAWLNTASEEQLVAASVGADPSLRDIVRMVHPRPTDPMREALFAWLLGKPHSAKALPAALQGLAAFRADRTSPVPKVPFQMLTALELTREDWAAIALNGGWQMLRMNLNTFARHGVFEIPGLEEQVAARLRDPAAVRRARVMPYQLMAAYGAASHLVPAIVKEALQDAMEVALEGLGSLPGRVVVCPDVSGSMSSPITGHRRGATTVVRCIDVAALVTAAIVRSTRGAQVLPFAEKVKEVALNPRDSVMTNTAKLAALGGGGTSCSAPIARLVKAKAQVDLVVLVSDNQSWVDARAAGSTETMRLWLALRVRNPNARLVCIDLQPNRTTQALERPDVLNVGGFTDEVFEMVARFADGTVGSDHWVGQIEAIGL